MASEALDLEWRIEAVCRKAWPALEEVVHGDWLLRFAGGDSRRVNSANPSRPSIGNIDGTIATVEEFYRARRRPALFRIPALIDPPIERALDRRGYGLEGETLTLFAELEAPAADDDREVLLFPRPEPEWLTAMARLQNQTIEQRQIYRRIVSAITLPAAFGACRADGALVSLAFAVIDDGLLCFESVVTDAGHRGRGFAHRVLAALLAWGNAHGARGVCLQVVASNAPALALYRRLGLTQARYRYHYRRLAAATA